MTRYLVAIHHPDDYDPAVAEDEAMLRDIDALNDEMKAAGVRVFVGGLHPAGSAKSLRAQPDGKVLVTDGPYLETREHVGGFWVLEAADLDEALEWGRKASVACRARPSRSGRSTDAGSGGSNWAGCLPAERPPTTQRHADRRTYASARR
ncbi:MAG: YciI family protein [Pseudaminobacter sp.]